MADTLHFDDATHTYTLQPRGIILPSVSAIISPLVDMSRIPRDRLDFARDRGKAVHRACELVDLGTLDYDDLDEQLVPYVQAWCRFLDEHKPTWSEIEKPGYHPKLLYAGTPDRRGKIGGKLVVVDMKATYALHPAVQVQLSGYDLMYGDAPADELWSVRLKKDGTFELKKHAAAHPTFLSCLNIFRWKQKNA